MIKMNLHMKMAEIKISQRDLSHETGIRQATLSAYYNDSFKMIPKEHLDSLCKFFKCTVGDLIEFIDN